MLLNSEPFVQTLSRWNHRTGTWTAMTGETYYEASIAYPAREGVRRAADLSITGSGTTTTRAVKQSFGDGRDVVMTITLRPDSTIAVTTDGRPIATRRLAPPPNGRLHVFIMEHSVESDVRVRALRIWSIGRFR